LSAGVAVLAVVTYHAGLGRVGVAQLDGALPPIGSSLAAFPFPIDLGVLVWKHLRDGVIIARMLGRWPPVIPVHIPSLPR
jgi:hypothetical protein